MASPFAFLVALVLLSCRSTCSLGWDLPHNYTLGLDAPETEEESALSLLRQMRRMPLYSCRNYRKDFKFPQETLLNKQVQEPQARCVLQEMTQQIFDLFSTQESSAAWEETLLDRLLADLHEQLSDLEACEMQQVGVAEPGLMAVRKYFQGLTVYLRQQKYVPCAWEVVRAEVMRSFSATVNLQERLKEQGMRPGPTGQ